MIGVKYVWCVFGRPTNGQEAPLWSPVTIECCNLLYSAWKPSLTGAAEWCFVADCRNQWGWSVVPHRSVKAFYRITWKLIQHMKPIRLLSYWIITVRRRTHNQNHTYKDRDCKDNVWEQCQAHPGPSSVSQGILTLLLHHRWLITAPPMTTISCISRWSQACFTSLTRPLSGTMLIGTRRTLSMDVCMKVYGRKYFCKL